MGNIARHISKCEYERLKSQGKYGYEIAHLMGICPATLTNIIKKDRWL